MSHPALVVSDAISISHLAGNEGPEQHLRGIEKVILKANDSSLPPEERKKAIETFLFFEKEMERVSRHTAKRDAKRAERKAKKLKIAR